MGFGLLDYVGIGVYLGVMLAIGWHFRGKQRSTDDYFLGGRNIHWFPIAISVFASLFSSISFIATPAEAYNNGMMLFLFSAAVLLGVPPAVILFVRFFRGLALTTAYEYLERRFNLGVRLIASSLFLGLRCLYLGVVLFAASVALHPATGWPVWLSILIVGVLSTAYTTMGGMKSVIWTDVVQFFVLLGGILLILALLAAEHPQGLVGIWDNARVHGRTFNGITDSAFYGFDPFQRVTFWAIIVSAIFTKASYAGADQVSIQRYLSTRSVDDASRSLIWGTILGIPVMFVLFLTGLGLFYFYQVHPTRALDGMTGDHVLAHFLATELPPGVGGVIMAAILAAVMSTFDSGVNSLAACTVMDFYVRVFRPDATQCSRVRIAKVATVGWGAASILAAGLITWIFGTESDRNSLVDITNVVVNLFSGILLGIFLLGIVTSRTTPLGAIVGSVAGSATSLGVTARYYLVEMPPQAPRLSFLWINILGCLVTIAVGYSLSFAMTKPSSEKTVGLTWWNPANPSNDL